jgi:hypothetical protein
MLTGYPRSFYSGVQNFIFDAPAGLFLEPEKGMRGGGHGDADLIVVESLRNYSRMDYLQQQNCSMSVSEIV